LVGPVCLKFTLILAIPSLSIFCFSIVVVIGLRFSL
jgi:hypothetical protein